MEIKKKYPRTYHLSFSEALQSDDKLIESLDGFMGKEVSVSLKMDGENTTLYPDEQMHARSLDSAHNWTRDVAKRIHSVIRHDIPEGHRLCCENVYAKHSIYYPDGYLEGYLYLLSVWNGDTCLSVDDTNFYAEALDLPRPKELYRGEFDIDVLKKLSKALDKSIEEGFVVRVTDAFEYKDFSKFVTKFVRAGHVQPESKHWLQTATPNGEPMQPCKPAFMASNPRRKVKP